MSTEEGEAVKPSHEALFYRGTTLGEIVYAVKHNGGKLESPHTEFDGQIGTIITTDKNEADTWAEYTTADEASLSSLNSRLPSLGSRFNKPITLEFTKHIPTPVFEVESGTDGYLSTSSPINLLEGSLTEASRQLVNQELKGTVDIPLNLNPPHTISDKQIEDIFTADERIRSVYYGDKEDFNLSDLDITTLD